MYYKESNKVICVRWHVRINTLSALKLAEVLEIESNFNPPWSIVLFFLYHNFKEHWSQVYVFPDGSCLHSLCAFLAFLSFWSSDEMTFDSFVIPACFTIH